MDHSSATEREIDEGQRKLVARIVNKLGSINKPNNGQQQQNAVNGQPHPFPANHQNFPPGLLMLVVVARGNSEDDGVSGSKFNSTTISPASQCK